MSAEEIKVMEERAIREAAVALAVGTDKALDELLPRLRVEIAVIRGEGEK